MKNYSRFFLTTLCGVLIAGFVAYHVNSTYPIVGWDHKYFLTRLIDTELHYQINGLTIQWYTPSFGGGLPAYPHPLNAQFSLPQFLTLLIDPWTSLLISYFVYVLIGYFATYIFLKHSLDFRWTAATLGAILFSASGFYLEHMANGHLNFQAFPLLPVFLVALFDKRLRLPVAVALFGLTSAVVVYSASIYPAVFIALATLMLLPLAYMIRPSAYDVRRFAKVLIFGGLLAAGLNVSKLYAVNSFMRFFPRTIADHFDVPLRIAPVGLFLQLAGVMGIAPIYAITGEKMTTIRLLLQAYTGAPVGLWELDLSMSPVLWFLLGGGVLALGWRLLTQRLAVLPRKKGFWLALILFLFAVELAMEFTFARGLFYPHLRQLPFLRAMHVNTRFGASFIFPLAVLGAWVFQSWTKSWPEKKALAAFLPVGLLALVALGAYLLIPLDKLQQRVFDISGLEIDYWNIRKGATFPIESIADINDQRVFDQDASNLYPYEVLFGYNLQDFKPKVHVGPVDQVSDGFFNMTDPTGLVYPEVNGSSLFSRIPVSERQQLEEFINHRQPNWKLPLAQHLADWVSFGSLLLTLGLFAYGMKQKRARFRCEKKHLYKLETGSH